MKFSLLSALAVLLLAVSSLHAQRGKSWQSQASAAVLKYAKSAAEKESRESVKNGTGKRELYAEGMQFLYDDLDNDGDTDAVASFFTEGEGSGSGVGHTVICLNDRRGPRIALSLYDSDLSDMLGAARVKNIGNSRSGVRLKSTSGSRILFTTYDYHPDDGMCCPSIQGVVEFVYADGRLGFSRVMIPAHRETESN